ncbi:MAG: phosphatidylglycerophosphatase A [bacterium]|nr:phosphatidylglycerophosphatase A [bacterium]MBU1916704.1 phosphatidylglycerophosphatase A [bacterium]
MFHKLIKFLAAGLGLGYVPFAPGTFGTILGSLMFFLLKDVSHIYFIQITVVVAIISLVIAHLAEKSFGEKDCQKIVIDEVAGVLVCYAFVSYSLFNLVMGFILFRLFDIAKIFPARQAQDQLKGGLGVVGDDVIAGIQAGLLLYFLPNIFHWVQTLIQAL